MLLRPGLLEGDYRFSEKIKGPEAHAFPFFFNRNFGTIFPSIRRTPGSSAPILFNFGGFHQKQSPKGFRRRFQLPGAQESRKEAWEAAGWSDEVDAQGRRWTFCKTLSFRLISSADTIR
jgi:hypothetical protein